LNLQLKGKKELLVRAGATSDLAGNWKPKVLHPKERAIAEFSMLLDKKREVALEPGEYTVTASLSGHMAWTLPEDVRKSFEKLSSNVLSVKIDLADGQK
jgi:hypothetical protein